MPYAAVSDVHALAPFVPINAQSQPSEGQVSRWIADVESTLNTTLTLMGYPVPLQAMPGKSTTAAITILRQMVSNAVMAMVLRGRPQPETDPEAFQKRYDAVLKQLRDPDDSFMLPDVVTTGQAISKESPVGVLSNLRDLLESEPRIGRNTVF